MPLQTFSAFAWGTADDISAYSAVGTAAVVSGNTDPFGTTNAYRIADVGGTAEARFKALTGLPNGTSWFAVFVRGDTATTSGLEVWDNTASAVRHRIKFAWSGGVPATPTVVTGAGTILPPISLGSLWYLLLFSADSIVGANANRLYLYPADPSNAADTGRAFFYVRNVVALDLIDFAKSYKRPKPGYRATVAPSGVRDAWSYGNDPVFKGTARWLPATARSNAASVLVPQVVSGWYGENESTGVNCGLLAALAAGWDMQAMTFAPDISACATNYSGYLTQPGENFEPDLESSGDYQVPLEFVGTGAIVPGI